MKSKCGEKMKQVVVAEYDFSDIAGLPVVVRGIRMLRCAKCGEEMMIGKETDRALDQIGRAIVAHSERLGPKEARFLRGHLGLTQKELADRMGIHKITVAGWESKKPISPQHDLIMRAIVLAALAEDAAPTLAALQQVHKAGPRPQSRRLVVQQLAS